MKVFAVVLLFVALAFADANSTSITCALTGTQQTASCMDVDTNEWTKVELAVGVSQCTTTTYEEDDIASGNVYVLAIRPGDDGTGNMTMVTSTGFIGTAPVGCVQIQDGQTEDDFDYSCFAISSAFNGTSMSYTVTVNPNAATVATTVEVYSGFAEGAAGACTSDMVSSSGSSIWLWVIIAVIVVVAIVIIVGAVAGFLIMKKKKSSYQLYEDA